jgi:hypothetical protein
MIRLNMVVEGQTEESFANRVIVPHLSSLGIYPNVQLIVPRKASTSRVLKGGWNSYSAVRSHLLRWMKNDHGDGVWFTTMLDLYAIPPDFPGLAQAKKIEDYVERVTHLEDKFREDLLAEGLYRFMPYLQLHEFEALLFVDPQSLKWEFLEHDKQIQRLTNLAKQFQSPEEIDCGPTTAPSKRLISEIPEYQSRKASAGPVVAEKIGLPKLRDRCRHFGQWLTDIEKLSEPSVL